MGINTKSEVIKLGTISRLKNVYRNPVTELRGLMFVMDIPNLRVAQLTVQTGLSAFISTILIVAIALIFSPLTVRSQASDTGQFTVTQTITGEISLTIGTAAVSMSGSINGLTGGYATGTTYAVVQTNDPDGYNMTLVFPYATTSGMQGDNTASVINNYSPVGVGVPDYNWVSNGGGGASEFGYTVFASTTADLDLTFRNNGSACANNSGGDVQGKCWLNATVTPETIVNRTSGAAATGATTTIRFKVEVPSNPSPALEADTYTATGTLTATNN